MLFTELVVLLEGLFCSDVIELVHGAWRVVLDIVLHPFGFEVHISDPLEHLPDLFFLEDLLAMLLMVHDELVEIVDCCV